MLAHEVNILQELLAIEEKTKIAKEIEEKINAGDYSPKLLKERVAIEKTLKAFNEIKQERDDLEELIEMTEDAAASDILQLAKSAKILEEKISKLKVEGMFKEEADAFGAFIEINSGAGGTESQDWAEILERIYIRWAEAKKFKIEVVDRLAGASPRKHWRYAVSEQHFSDSKSLD